MRRLWWTKEWDRTVVLWGSPGQRNAGGGRTSKSDGIDGFRRRWAGGGHVSNGAGSRVTGQVGGDEIIAVSRADSSAIIQKGELVPLEYT